MKLHVRVLGLGLTHHHSDTAEEEETPAWPGSACLMGAMFWEELQANYTKVPFNRKQLFPQITSHRIQTPMVEPSRII